MEDATPIDSWLSMIADAKRDSKSLTGFVTRAAEKQLMDGIKGRNRFCSATPERGSKESSCALSQSSLFSQPRSVPPVAATAEAVRRPPRRRQHQQRRRR